MLDQLHPRPNSRHRRKLLGRGPGSGKGGRCGKGNKGQRCRAGAKIHPWSEGGQMPLYRRVPKRGFRNINRVEFQVINLRDISRLLEKGFDAEQVMDKDALYQQRVIRQKHLPVKVLADGEIAQAVKLKVDAISTKARELVEKAGGSVEVVEH